MAILQYLLLFSVLSIVYVEARFCKDHSPFCEEWEAAGYCQAHQSTRMLCRKTCGIICGSRSRPDDCKDSYLQCLAWAESGYCETNPYTKANCRKSCNNCPGRGIKYYLVPNSQGCWRKSGRKGGLSEKVCGKNGYCCRKGFSDCIKDMADLNPTKHHACIQQKTNEPNDEIDESDDLNECEIENGGCAHNCIDTPTSYSCECRGGYNLASDKHTCEDINECSSADDHLCHSQATCINTPGNYNCSCKMGYKGDGLFSCVDIDECAPDGDHDCHSQATCTNTAGGYTCSCNGGYKGDGYRCHEIDIDECAPGGDDDCHSQATCTNTVGGYTCACNAGYKGDGFQCEDVNECFKATQNGCAQRCSNTIGSFKCFCREGYELKQDQKGCIEKCENNNRKCTDWAKRGFCKTSNYMKKNCKSSCGLC